MSDQKPYTEEQLKAAIEEYEESKAKEKAYIVKEIAIKNNDEKTGEEKPEDYKFSFPAFVPSIFQKLAEVWTKPTLEEREKSAQELACLIHAAAKNEENLYNMTHKEDGELREGSYKVFMAIEGKEPNALGVTQVIVLRAKADEND